MAEQQYVNNAITTLAADITDSATTLTLTSATGFPTLAAGDWFLMHLVKSDGSKEIVKVTAISGVTCIIERAQEGTTAIAHTLSPVTAISVRVTAGTLDRFETGLTVLDTVEAASTAHVSGTSAHGTVGDIVGVSDTQDLTNKTLTSPKINEDVALTPTATELNQLAGRTLFESGTIMLFGQNSAPTGWTRKTNWQDNAMLCIASSGDIGGGGNVNPQEVHNHTIGAHSHEISGNHQHDMALFESSENLEPTNSRVISHGGMAQVAEPGGSSPRWVFYDHTEPTDTGDTQDSSAYNSEDSTAPYYQEVIAAIKD